MKKLALFLLPLLVLTGCENQKKQTFEVYKDDSVVTTDEWRVETADAYTLYGTNCDLYVKLKIKNLTVETKTISFSNSKVVRESNGASYQTSFNLCIGCKYTIESEIEQDFQARAIIPTDIDEHYYLKFEFANISYKVFLYNSPL